MTGPNTRPKFSSSYCRDARNISCAWGIYDTPLLPEHTHSPNPKEYPKKRERASLVFIKLSETLMNKMTFYAKTPSPPRKNPISHVLARSTK